MNKELDLCSKRVEINSIFEMCMSNELWVLLSIAKLLVYMDTVNSHTVSFSLLLFFCTSWRVCLTLSQSFFAPCSTYSQGISIPLPGTQTTSGATLEHQ